ncbi:MAG: hypothetical protein ACR2GU_03715, partial [Rubrobacteraceae bacterium]
LGKQTLMALKSVAFVAELEHIYRVEYPDLEFQIYVSHFNKLPSYYPYPIHHRDIRRSMELFTSVHETVTSASGLFHVG